MARQDKQHQAMHHDGQTGKTTAASRFTTADNARRIAQEKRQQLPKGSSDSYTVDKTRRRGR
jgi:hypothetical protein